MKKTRFSRILAMALVLLTLVSLLPASALAAGTVTYTLNASDLAAFNGGKVDGESQQAGTDGYFTIFYGASSKVDSSAKTFSDGSSASQRLNFQGKTEFTADGNVYKAVQIKTNGPATITLRWVSGGDGRTVAIYDNDGNIVAGKQTNAADSVKNSLYVTEFSLETAGTYYIGNPEGNNNYYIIDVTDTASDTEPVATPWAQVVAPVISAAEDDGNGNIKVSVDAVVGLAGGDQVVVQMLDASGKVVDERNSVLERVSHNLTFTPEGSGTYTFKASLQRAGEQSKTSAAMITAFVLPLGTPIISSGTSKGDGKIALAWSSVAEAEEYEILMGGQSKGTTSKTEYTVSGLTVGQKYTFTVVAIRGSERKESEAIEVTATKDEKVVWGFTYYGPSTNAGGNGYEGDLNEDGSVTVYSEGGKGKIQPSSVDGLAFYYTAIPTNYNFTLRAKVTVESWTLSNGQEGFGLMAADRLGVTGDNSSTFWNNSVMALASKIEYRYDAENEAVADINSTATKYSMKLGLGTLSKTGVTSKNLAEFLGDNAADAVNKYFVSDTRTLETAAGYYGKDAGTYNVIGNATDAVAGSLDQALLTEFILEIQKNNSGYFITYYDANGKVLAQQKYYGADCLNQLDKDYVYAGFFASRNARATFSDVQLTKILASEDAPAEEKPKTEITPIVNYYSGTVTTSKEYDMSFYANVAGTVQVTVNNEVVVEADTVAAETRYTKTLTLGDYGEYSIKIRFTPDPNQDLGEDTILASTSTVLLSQTIMYNQGYEHRKALYVSPTGLPNGNGSKEYPFDIYTAVEHAIPGQTIVLLEGTYKMTASLRIQRGMDGTADAPIRMIADPAAATRPVLDFQGEYTGIVHGGDYWYFAGFDVTNSQAGQKGFQVSGDHNVLDQINAYRNGNTGIQLSRFTSADTTIEDWPSYNLILNCTSYLNADPGEEDADGFAAKLTCGVGNVFDGCVAYQNADDGWDLYAKVETGSIGAVTIQNCVAYANGIREDGTVGKGNGNGFKMGGDSLSGKHMLINSIAFNNKSKGIDSNSCPDIIVKDSISYNNGTYNVAFYTNNGSNTNFTANGVISIKDKNSPYADSFTMNDNLKPKGNQVTAQYSNASTYYWEGGVCINSAGKKLTTDIFKSLEFKGIVRREDGSIDMQGFLELNDKAPSDVDAVLGSTGSQDMTTIPEDVAHNYSSEWFNTDSEYHWHLCDCGDRGDLAAHTLEWVVDREATPEQNGQRHQECTVCGHKRPAVEIYYSAPDATEPAESEPADQQPAKDPQGLSPVVIVVIVVVLVAALAAGVVFVLLPILKKKKAAPEAPTDAAE